MKEIIVKVWHCQTCPFFTWIGQASDEPACLHPSYEEFRILTEEEIDIEYIGVPDNCPLEKSNVMVKYEKR